MNKILADLSPAALVRANRANLYEFFRHFEHSPFMEFSKSDGLSRWNCDFQYSWYNAILCSRNATPADTVFIDESLNYFKSKNTPKIRLWLEDGVNLASWEALLIPRGFNLAEGLPGMSADLHRLNESSQIPAGAEIKVVNDEKGVRDCAEVIVRGYSCPEKFFPSNKR